MDSGRLEAFSDGVLAIIITIMVLELKAPEEATVHTLIPLLPVFLSYVVSFIYIGSYWNNHHHLFQITEQVNSKVLWANLNLLFWLSLIPFATSWMGENHLASFPTAFYGFILLTSAIAFFILQSSIAKSNSETIQQNAVQAGKNKLSLVFYALGIATSFLASWMGIVCYIAVLVMWFIPNKRIENSLNQ